MGTLPLRNWKLLTGILAVTLLAAPAALAQDAKLTVVTIKGSGTPTGSPQIDPELANLPGIALICIRFAKCEHEASETKTVAWDSTTRFGPKSSGVEVTIAPPTEVDGKQVFRLALMAFKGEKACSKSKAPASTRPVATVSCATKGSDVEYLHVVMAERL